MNALITVDFINEIVHEKGKLAGKGYAAFAARHATIKRASAALTAARARGFLVVHVRLGFCESYAALPTRSLLLGKARDFGALLLGSWGTELHEGLQVMGSDSIILKQRISPFYGTQLEPLLRAQEIKHVYIAGVATDLAVQSAARDAHDRDFAVTVLSDCCAAATDEDHIGSLAIASKFARVLKAGDVDLD